jgi:pyridoxamine 5'-phosphate oxidase family protein
MSVFTTAEIEYLRSRPPARLATVVTDGRPQVEPVGFLLDDVALHAGTGVA